MVKKLVFVGDLLWALDPYCAHLPILELFRQNTMNVTLRLLWSQNADTSRGICRYSRMVCSTSRCKIFQFCLRREFKYDQLQTPRTICRLFFTSIHDSRYTSVKWRLTSIGFPKSKNYLYLAVGGSAKRGLHYKRQPR